MQSIAYGLLLVFLICSCARNSDWKVDSIAANSSFDSSRLRYLPNGHSSLAFEMLRINTKIEAFLNLTQFRLKPSEEGDTVKVLINIGGELFEESSPLLEGRMRIRLSEEITLRMTEGLQDGKKISILVDGFEETLEPDQFASHFDRFLGKTFF